MPMMESKPADVFAFAMLAVEAFTGKMPFDKQRNEAAVVSILQGSRPEMPNDAQGVGLTAKMWTLLESCWQQNPKKRPIMGEVLRRWQKFVGRNNDGNNVDTECVYPQPRLWFHSQFPMIDLGNLRPHDFPVEDRPKPSNHQRRLRPSVSEWILFAHRPRSPNHKRSPESQETTYHGRRW